MQRCEEALYAESSTVGGQPVSMPRDLLEATVQLDTMLRKLEVAILDVVTDVNNKKKVGFEEGGGDNHLFFFLSLCLLICCFFFMSLLLVGF